MKKRIWFTNFIDVCFIIATICAVAVCIMDYSIATLIRSILFFVCSLVLIIAQIISFFVIDKWSYYFSANHTFYINGVNIFEDSTFLSNKPIKFERKYFRNQLATSKTTIIKNNNLNIAFRIYELDDNLQLLVFKNSLLRKKNIWISFNDMIMNDNILIERKGISNFPFDLGNESFHTIDKKNIIIIISDDDGVFTREYSYYSIYCSKIKEVFEKAFPCWRESRDCSPWKFESYEIAKKYTIDEIDRLNSLISREKPKHYFIYGNHRRGTAYHEFQTGNKKDVFWDKTSILLSENIMEESNLISLFEKVIPNYDYYGRSIVTRKTWELLKEEAKKESKIIKDIIDEMTSWAEQSIEIYNCFTIIGI